MAVVVDHSANFPRDFAACPDCGKKGYYRIQAASAIVERDGRREAVITVPSMMRCRYCKHQEAV